MSMICYLREADESQIDQLLADPESIHDLLEEESGEVELGKAWHGIHFLLTGSEWEGEEPLCYLVRGGEEVGDEDVGYGPARVLRPNQVARWAAALLAILADEMRRRYDQQAMLKAEIYPQMGWHVPEALGYLLEYYGALSSFVEQARDRGKGAIIHIG